MLKRIIGLVFVAVVAFYGATALTGCGDGSDDGGGVYEACIDYYNKMAKCDDINSQEYDDMAKTTCTGQKDIAAHASCTSSLTKYYDCMTDQKCENIGNDEKCRHYADECNISQ